MRTDDCSPGPESAFGTGRLIKFNGDFLVQKYIYDQHFHKNLISFPEIRAKLWKNALSCNTEEAFKKFLDPHSEVSK